MNPISANFSTQPSHQQVQILLPWYVNNTLNQHEQQQVEEHLQGCLICRREIQELRKISDGIQFSNELDIAADLSFAELMGKLPKRSPRDMPVLDTPDPVLQTKGRFTVSSFRLRKLMPVHKPLPKQWAIAAVVLLALLPIGVTNWFRLPTADYFTLASAKPETTATVGTQLRVVFARATPESEIDNLLTRIHATRSAKPNSAGAITVTLLAAAQQEFSQQAAVSLLRQQPQVLLAEPVLIP